MAALIPGGLTTQTREPLDGKYIVDAVTDLNNGLIFDGLQRFVKATQLVYIRKNGVWGRFDPNTDDLDNRLTTAIQDLQTLKNRVDSLTNGGSSGGSGLWQPVTRWLNGLLINSSNENSYCDNKLFRKIGDNQYETRILPGNTIDMSWYFTSDGGTDNSDAWDVFNTYMGQMYTTGTSTKVNLVFSTGTYYFSRPIIILGRKYNIRGPGSVLFGPHANFQVLSNDATNVEFHDLYWSATSKDPTDGAIYPQDGKLLKFVQDNNIPTGIQNSYQETLDDYLYSPAFKNKQLLSLNPRDYKWQGLYTTSVIKVYNCEIVGFSGGGIFLNAESISYADSSLSIIKDTKVRQCHGPGIAIYGVDANHIKIMNCDTRDGATTGLIDMSQSGAQVWGHHAAINIWGDYWMVSNGPWSLMATYSEIQSRMSNVFNGEGTVTGGPINSPIASGSGNFCVQRGNSFSSISGNIAFERSMVWRGDTRYDDFAMLISDDKKSWNMKQAGTVNNIWGFNTLGTSLTNGRSFSLPGTSTSTLYLGAKMITAVDNAANISSIKTFFREGDEIHIEGVYEDQVAIYKCIASGANGGATYADYEGLTCTNVAGAQNFGMNGVSKYIYNGAVILVNGQPRQILTCNRNGGTQNSVFSLSFPGVDLQGGVGTITLPPAQFAAIGEARGITDQRNNLTTKLTANDTGFNFHDITLHKKLMWDGAIMKWRDFMGTIIN